MATRISLNGPVTAQNDLDVQTHVLKQAVLLLRELVEAQTGDPMPLADLDAENTWEN